MKYTLNEDRPEEYEFLKPAHWESANLWFKSTICGKIFALHSHAYLLTGVDVLKRIFVPYEVGR